MTHCEWISNAGFHKSWNMWMSFVLVHFFLFGEKYKKWKCNRVIGCSELSTCTYYSSYRYSCSCSCSSFSSKFLYSYSHSYSSSSSSSSSCSYSSYSSYPLLSSFIIYHKAPHPPLSYLSCPVCSLTTPLSLSLSPLCLSSRYPALSKLLYSLSRPSGRNLFVIGIEKKRKEKTKKPL